VKMTEYAGIGVLALACFAMSGGTTARSEAPAAVQHFDSIQETKYPWGWIRWMMNNKVDAGAAQTFGIVEIQGKGRNTLHKHPNCEELLYVLSGTATHQIGDKKVSIKKGDLIRVPPNTPHMAIVTSTEPLLAVISYSSGDRQVVDLGPGKE
jgi:mannose-6-phosphate isomerase-like protein (cupin superfamily)